MPTPAAIASEVDQPVTSRPFTSLLPPLGAHMPLRTRLSVDLPAPFSPTSEWISPAATSRLAPSFATTGPNRFTISVSLIAGVVIPSPACLGVCSARDPHVSFQPGRDDDPAGDDFLLQRLDA